MVPLGEAVLEMACAQARSWAEMRPGEPPLTMSVNLSPAQLLSPTMPAAVERALASSGLEPYFLCLEITERTLMVDGPATAASIAALSGMGVRLAIDDFGTGYSSLSYLRLLPVDSLKVDAVFVEGLGRRRDDKAIVGAVIQMAHALGMGVVAEGVESEEQVSAAARPRLRSRAGLPVRQAQPGRRPALRDGAAYPARGRVATPRARARAGCGRGARASRAPRRARRARGSARPPPRAASAPARTRPRGWSCGYS